MQEELAKLRIQPVREEQKQPAPQRQDKVKCPVCGSVQNAGRSVCWDCGAKFRDDEA
jgi:uncharacterized OB-fold protein